MKYVIFEGNGLVHPILFGDHTTHLQISVAGGTPVSAGFVKFDSMNWPHCYGESESLKLKSRGEMDEDIIRRAYGYCDTYMFMVDFYKNEDDKDNSK